MHHKSVLTVGNANGRPYHIQCSCGSAGDFPKEEQAVAWYNAHTTPDRIGKTGTRELSVPGAAQPKPKPPAAPAAPAGGTQVTGGATAKEAK